jgi:hypothetical protein
MGIKPPFLLSLGRHSTQAGDVSLAHPSDLSLAKHVHDFIPMKRSPRRFHG